MRLIANSHIFISNQVSRYFMRPNRQSKQNHLLLHALHDFMAEKFVFTKQHHRFCPNSKGFMLVAGWLHGCKSWSSVVVEDRLNIWKAFHSFLNSFKKWTENEKFLGRFSD